MAGTFPRWFPRWCSSSSGPSWRQAEPARGTAVAGIRAVAGPHTGSWDMADGTVRSQIPDRFPNVSTMPSMRKTDVTHLDPRGPLVFNTRALTRGPGSERTEARVVPAPSGLNAGMAGVPEGAEMTLD